MGSKCFASLKSKDEDKDIIPLIIKNLDSSFEDNIQHKNPPYDPTPILVSIDTCDSCSQEGSVDKHLCLSSNLDDHL